MGHRTRAGTLKLGVGRRHGISPAIQKAEATADAAAQTCRYVLDVKLCD